MVSCALRVDLFENRLAKHQQGCLFVGRVIKALNIRCVQCSASAIIQIREPVNMFQSFCTISLYKLAYCVPQLCLRPSAQRRATIWWIHSISNSFWTIIELSYACREFKKWRKFCRIIERIDSPNDSEFRWIWKKKILLVLLCCFAPIN